MSSELPLTLRPGSPHHAGVSAQPPTPLQQTLRWLTTHAGFPARRLPDKAELLLLIATAAADLEGDASRDSAQGKISSNPNFNAQIRHYTIQRRRVHLKSDNSAKT